MAGHGSSTDLKDETKLCGLRGQILWARYLARSTESVKQLK